ncbi:F-box protein At5g52880 [Impatiens glandulifera]|uniref:F-box protein At5g52880 n=1 Tax=Impatiens glandulifera TaxID=253017 RepID=UPI001FB18FBA|nr:F-box protein At5g52880 [Impatiens glandulifera]
MGLVERYKKLGLRESLHRAYQYPVVCKELSFILKGAYRQVPKNLQSFIFEDVLTAFHLLPEMQTQTAVSAAYALLQTAESVLPKQKRVLAVSEFKHAKISHKRRSKVSSDSPTSSAQLSEDVLVHVFSFLDLRSLISASQVSRSWNQASCDNHLWCLQYNIYFFQSCNHLKSHCSRIDYEDTKELLTKEPNYDWKGAFVKAFRGKLARKFRSFRAYCICCDSVVWLSNMKCPQGGEHKEQKAGIQILKPISTEQIVDFILHNLDDYSEDDSTSNESSDSDEGDFVHKLWALPRHLDQIL